MKRPRPENVFEVNAQGAAAAGHEGVLTPYDYDQTFLRRLP
jgi:hypothetical protein